MSETKFNPKEYGSFQELPPEQQENFESLEGGKGFVLKTVERDPEIAHCLALLEDRAITKLKDKIESRDTSFDDLLSRYKEAANKRDYTGKRELAEGLKEISDYAVLRGGDQDPEVKTEFAKAYEQLTYSRIFQDELIASLPKEDPEIIAKVVLDPKFSNGESVIYKIGDEAVLQKVYGLAKTNLKVVGAIVNCIKNLDVKVAILQDIDASIKGITEPREKATKQGDSSLESMRQTIAWDLARAKRYDTLFSLIEQDVLGQKDIKDLLPTIPSDELLYEFARRAKTWQGAAMPMKYMKSRDMVMQIAKACLGETDFQRLLPAEKTTLADAASRLHDAFTNKPKMVQLGQLRETKTRDKDYTVNVENKFIIGLKTGERSLTIAWSNTQLHNQHQNQFEDLSYSNSEQDFPVALRSGGFIKIENLPDGSAKVVLNERSAGYGPYNKTMLDAFKVDIEDAIKKALKKEIEFTIEESK